MRRRQSETLDHAPKDGPTDEFETISTLTEINGRILPPDRHMRRVEYKADRRVRILEALHSVEKKLIVLFGDHHGKGFATANAAIAYIKRELPKHVFPGTDPEIREGR